MSEIEIRVAARTKAQALAASIIAAVREGHEVTLLAIGPFPIAAAYKSICIANKTLAAGGKLLCIVPGMESRQIPKRDDPSVNESWVVTLFRIRDYVVSASS